MTKYSISTIHTGVLKEDSLSAEEFVLRLHSQWHAVETRPTVDPQNPYILEWQAQIGPSMIIGRLGRKHYSVEFEGSADTVARFAVWYRTLVPFDYRLGFSQLETASGEYYVELEYTTSERDIVTALDRQSKHKKRAPNMAWRVIPGGYVGKFSEHMVAIQALFFTPQEELWAALAPGASIYVQEQWLQTSEPRIVVNTQGQWQQMDTLYMPCVWYRDQLWGVAEQGFVIYDQGKWHSASMVPFSYVTCLAVDPANWLWVGTLMHGLWRSVDGQRWEHMPLPSNAHGISALWSDGKKTIWVAESGQHPASRPIYRWFDGAWEALPLPPKPQQFHHILQLTTDATGRLWVGTSVHGVWLWANESWTHFKGTQGGNKIGLPGSSISGLCVDRQQRVWALTHNGIGCFQDGVWRLVRIASAAPSHERVLPLWNSLSWSPCSCHLAEDGRLWIGTSDGQIGWINTTQSFYDNPQQYILTDIEPMLITIER